MVGGFRGGAGTGAAGANDGAVASAGVVDIVVVGSANLDTTMRTSRLPEPGETVLGGRMEESVGGKGANQAVAAARLGGSVAFVGLVGDDAAGERIRSALGDEGVDTNRMGTVSQRPSGRAVVLVDDAGENVIVVSPGANGALSAEHVRTAGPLLAAAGVVVCQREIPDDAVAEAVRLAGGTVILNPSPAGPVARSVLERVDVMLVNRSELGILAAAEQPESIEAARRLAAGLSGPGAVVVTLGDAGALVSADGEQVHVPAVEVRGSVDPTGAGDTFCGALAEALVRGERVDDAARRAVRAAASAVSGAGAQAAMPTARQLDGPGAW